MGHPDEVDVIVCGGGPAGVSHPGMPALRVFAHLSIGCVTAGRLAFADPTLKVMLIEGSSLRMSVRSQHLIIIQAVPTTVTTHGSTVLVSTSKTCKETECKRFKNDAVPTVAYRCDVATTRQSSTSTLWSRPTFEVGKVLYRK